MESNEHEGALITVVTGLCGLSYAAEGLAVAFILLARAAHLRLVAALPRLAF
jgi:hypothetical protein